MGMGKWGYDDPGGVIVGGHYSKYEFWTDKKELVIRKYFESDDKAIEWFKTNYPAEFKAGLTMKVWY